MSATHANRGRIAELAIARQASAYAIAGRAWLARQRVQEATGRDGRVLHVSSAPVDFLGALSGGRALALECKQEGGTAVALSRFDDEQRGALEALHALGAEVLVAVVFMRPEPEAYVVPWSPVAAFMAAPWRASLSRAWCRVEGRAASCYVESGELKRIAFLDTWEHPGREQARAEVERDRQAAIARPAPLTLELDEPMQSPRASVYSGLSDDAIRDRIVAATNDGVARQLRHQRRAPLRRRRS